MWDEIELRHNAYRACCDFLGGSWSRISAEELEISQVSGGLSNKLYRCRLPKDVDTLEDEIKDVLLRIYGDQIGSNVNAALKDAVIYLLLAEKKLGPKLHGIFPNGRLEEYIPSRCATWKDLRQPGVSAEVAKELAKAHALRAPIKKQPEWLLEQMRKWCTSLVNNICVDKLKPCQRKIAEYLLNSSLDQEIDWMEYELQRLKSPAVFSHNDLQGGNILILNKSDDKPDNSLMFIDYEFCCYNYRGFDIGNHFCEWCYSYNDEDYPHFSSDLSRFPTEEQQLTFIRAYLHQMEEIGLGSSCISNEKEILKEVQLFAPCSHLIWSMWSFHMALTSTIKFGFWEYGKTRLEAYFLMKERYRTSRMVSSIEDVNNGH